ncbi:MAG: hypothetical protein JWN73_3 [Betaproteobacteria bacterium]|nr:hypothetical protein [Betaproteobacteria bacterium]
MAVFNLKSTTITNRDTVPAVINDGRLERGSLKSSVGSVSAGTTDTGGATYAAGSTYVLASLPSTALVRNVLLSCAALTSGVVSVGVGLPTAKSGGAAFPAAINATATALFASAQSVATALSKSNITNQSGNYPLNKQELPLWSAAGLTADPGGLLDIVVLVTTSLTAGGLIGLEVQYVDNGS